MTLVAFTIADESVVGAADVEVLDEGREEDGSACAIDEVDVDADGITDNVAIVLPGDAATVVVRASEGRHCVNAQSQSTQAPHVGPPFSVPVRQATGPSRHQPQASRRAHSSHVSASLQASNGIVVVVGLGLGDGGGGGGEGGEGGGGGEGKGEGGGGGGGKGDRAAVVVVVVGLLKLLTIVDEREVTEDRCVDKEDAVETAEVPEVVERVNVAVVGSVMAHCG